jgi:hypothetical protein
MNKNTKIEPLLLGRDPLSAKAVLLGQSPPSGSGPTIALTLVGASRSSLTLGSKPFFWVGTHFRLGSPGAAQNRSRLSSSGASRDRVPEGKNRGPRSAGAPRSHGAPDGGENRGGAPDPPLEAPKGCPFAPADPLLGILLGSAGWGSLPVPRWGRATRARIGDQGCYGRGAGFLSSPCLSGGCV